MTSTSTQTRAGLVAVTALVTALLALAVSVWAAVSVSRTHEEIRHLGEILTARPGPHGMSLAPPPPKLDDPD